MTLLAECDIKSSVDATVESSHQYSVEAVVELPIASAQPSSVVGAIGTMSRVGRRCAWFHLTAPGAQTGLCEADLVVIERCVRAGIDAGIPLVGIIDAAGWDTTVPPAQSMGALHGWGRVARAFADASGMVPTVIIVNGPMLAGPSLLLGIADIVIMTATALAYVNDPETCARVTGTSELGDDALGGVHTHFTRSGVAHLCAIDLDDALSLTGDVLDHLPDNNTQPPLEHHAGDPIDRASHHAQATVPLDQRCAYDMHAVITDLVDDGNVTELQAGFGTCVITALGRLGGRPVGIVANQPASLAGALDIDGSQKAARFVRWCDSFGLSLVTLVDTPGFRPGKDQEWRGMIRHGAQLVFAYAEATVPRVCVIVRKAYGGAFIVMDCKTMGNDACFAWPSAQVAVMGAAGAVEILHRRELAAARNTRESETIRTQLITQYEEQFLSPRLAAERGYIDAVIEPDATRSAIIGALNALQAKREQLPRRRHANMPL